MAKLAKPKQRTGPTMWVLGLSPGRSDEPFDLPYAPHYYLRPQELNPQPNKPSDLDSLDLALLKLLTALFRGQDIRMQLTRIRCPGRADIDRPLALILPRALAERVAENLSSLWTIGEACRSNLQKPFDLAIYSDDENNGLPPNRILAWLSWGRDLGFKERLSETFQAKSGYCLMPIAEHEGLTLLYSINDTQSKFSEALGQAYRHIDSVVRTVLKMVVFSIACGALATAVCLVARESSAVPSWMLAATAKSALVAMLLGLVAASQWMRNAIKDDLVTRTVANLFKHG